MSMWKTEEDFPRGGPKTKNKASSTPDGDKPKKEWKGQRVAKSKAVEAETVVKSRKRKFSDGDSPAKSKVSKKRKKEPVSSLIETPLKDLETDLCVLGCVRQAHDYNVSMSLPGNVVATLPITDISPSYTQQLQALAHSEDPDRIEEVTPADELLRPGMLLPVKIKDITDDKQRDKKIIKLSTNPSDINSNLPLKAVEDGLPLYGNVSSVEDHGYRIDLGIKGLQAFLTTKDAEKFIQMHQNGSPLCVGQPVWCVLKMKDSSGLKAGESRVVSVTIDPDIVRQAMVSETSNLNTLVPGMNMTALVQSTTDSGLHVRVFSFQGEIHSSQLPKSPTQYRVGDELQVKVLYINNANKVLQLTALPKIVHFNGGPIQFFGDLRIGSILEASVHHTTNRKGVYFKLPNNVKGFAALSQLSDKANPELSKYEKGDVYQCRVMGFNYMEGVALVTLKESILTQKFLSVADLSVGEVVEATVKDVTSNGVVVKLSKSMFAFIPCMHLADVPIKHPEKKFEAGMKMKCRVLKIDHQKSKVMLTHKRSLVKTKYPILTDYSQLRPHMELEGYIVAVKENVVIVAFFNDVKGYVTLKDMSTEKVEDPSTMFYTGQVIRCRVVFYNVDEKKLKLSFNFGSKSKDEKASVEASSNFKIGKVMEARVVKQEREGFQVMLQPSRELAYLPFIHLSDFHEVQELKKMAIKPGQQLDKVTYFNQKQKNMITMKESIIQAAEENQLVENFEDLKSGMLLPAVIKNHQDYGMFLELAAGHTGLCPAKTLTYLQPSNLQELFRPGQSVMTRLSKVDTEKNRFLGSVRLDEVYEGGIEAPLSLLRNYLLSREKTLALLFAEHDELSVYEEVSVGDVVDFTISSAMKKGVLGDLASGAKALATKKHLGGIEPHIGNEHKAVVLFVDPLTPCVELSLDQKLVKSVTTRKENSKTQLKNGQILKADVLLIKSEFMLMSLRGHGAGKLIYVPVKQHINDVDLGKPYEVGTYTEVVLKDPCGENNIAVLKSQDPETVEKEREEKFTLRNLPKHDMQPGMMVEAKIKAVHPLQLNLVANKLHGRVHITEVTDKVKEGASPLDQFRQGQTVNAKVIGLRDVKSNSYLPITNPKSKRTLLECSLKESKVTCESLTELLIPKVDVHEGDKVVAYVIKVSSNKVWVQLSLTQQGYIDFFHLSTEASVLNDVTTHFQTGQAVKATVVECDHDDKVVLSRIGGRMKLDVGENVTAQISSMKPNSCLYVKLPAGRIGVVNTKPSVLHYVGQYIRCHVEEVEDTDRCILSLLDESKSVVKLRKRRRDTSVSETESKEVEKEIIRKKKQMKKEKKKKRSEDNEEQGDSGVDVAKDSSDSDHGEDRLSSQPVSDAVKESETPRLSIQGFSWGGDLVTKEDKDKDESDDDGDEVKIDKSKMKKKRKRDEEKLIQEYERNQLEGNTDPQSAADFERLVLQSPNSSVVWLRYMAFHVELGELEKARAVAEKALGTISFREEQEKKNVWLAYLNMETMYGDTDDVKKLLDRAVSYNDPLDIYLKMCDIYVTAGKTEEAEQLYAVISRKYKREKSVWKSYGQFLFKAGRVQTARSLLQRSVSVLDKKDHVEVIAKFANLEFTDGDKERGRTMFENLIASYPGRTDLWSVYVDMVAKVGDIEGARQIMERAVKQKLNSKKLSFLVQKFIRFEETHGTDAQVQHVKDMALTLFDS